jgi:hypothetical protein
MARHIRRKTCQFRGPDDKWQIARTLMLGDEVIGATTIQRAYYEESLMVRRGRPEGYRCLVDQSGYCVHHKRLQAGNGLI